MEGDIWMSERDTLSFNLLRLNRLFTVMVGRIGLWKMCDFILLKLIKNKSN